MKSLSWFVISSAVLLLAVPESQADTTPAFRTKLGAMMAMSGKLSSFRAQIKGVEFGSPNDRLDAEVLVTLDSEPDMVFGVSYHEEEASTSEVIDTLREAYLHNIPVTLSVLSLPGGRKNLPLISVQLGKP